MSGVRLISSCIGRHVIEVFDVQKSTLKVQFGANFVPCQIRKGKLNVGNGTGTIPRHPTFVGDQGSQLNFKMLRKLISELDAACIRCNQRFRECLRFEIAQLLQLIYLNLVRVLLDVRKVQHHRLSIGCHALNLFKGAAVGATSRAANPCPEYANQQI